MVNGQVKLSFLRGLSSLSSRFWFFLVAGLAAAERIGLYLVYRPAIYSDTHSYRRLAGAIRQGWHGYDGTRTPGYPLFLALCRTEEGAYLAQLVLGLLTTLLVFYLGWRVSQKGWFGALAALAHSLNPQQLFFEASLITESLTTFLLACALAGLAHLLYARPHPGLGSGACALAIGLAGGLTALVRPLFVFLPVWLALFLLFGNDSVSRRPRWGLALTAAVSGLALLALWAGFLYQRFGRWGLTTMTGYHLVQHTGVFFEYVPDRYAPLRDTYLAYRARRLAETGQSNNAIWEAIPAMQQASGLSFYDLSDTLARLSYQLIRRHPMLYLRNVVEGWFWFWKAPVYWSPTLFVSPVYGEVVRRWVNVAHVGLIVSNGLFLAGVAVFLWRGWRVRWPENPFLYCLTGAILTTSLLQTLLDHGDNPRFAVPLQTFILLLVLWWSTSVLTTWHFRDSSKIGNGSRRSALG